MIRNYRGIPRFDDGLNFGNVNDLNIPQLMATLPQAQLGINYQPIVPTTQENQSYFDMYPTFDTYGDDYVNPNIPVNEPTQTKTPVVSRRSSNRVNRSINGRNISKPTTAVQDVKNANREHAKAIAAAKAKAAKEKSVKEAAARKAMIEAAQARSLYWKVQEAKKGLKPQPSKSKNELPELVVTGKDRSHKTAMKRSWLNGLFKFLTSGSIAGSIGTMMGTYFGSRGHQPKVTPAQSKANKARVVKRNRGYNAYTLGQW